MESDDADEHFFLPLVPENGKVTTISFSFSPDFGGWPDQW